VVVAVIVAVKIKQEHFAANLHVIQADQLVGEILAAKSMKSAV